jgi:hypothetical protein
MDRLIIQNIPVRITAILTATVRTPSGADTQKILDSMLPEVAKRIKAIPWVAQLDAVGVEEIMPEMKSNMDN